MKESKKLLPAIVGAGIAAINALLLEWWFVALLISIIGIYLTKCWGAARDREGDA